MSAAPVAPAFASVGEAMDMARAALGYLAAADATQLAAETQAECLRTLERTDAGWTVHGTRTAKPQPRRSTCSKLWADGSS